jgi:hypothetical protein
MVSATYTFLASDVGNVVSVNVSDSGGLATIGRYEILSVASGKATVDRAWASANNTGTAGATAVIGGAFATPGQAGKTLSTANEGANSQKVFVKSGTYTLSTATAGPGGPFTNLNRAYVIVEGYETTRGDMGAKPVLDAGAQTNVILWNQQHANSMSFVNLSADGQGGTGNKGFYLYLYSEAWRCEAIDCSASGCYGFDYGNAVGCKSVGCYNGFARTNAYFCSAINSVNDGFTASSSNYQHVGCLAHGSGNDGFMVGSLSLTTNCTSDGNARHGFNCIVGSGYVRFTNCIASNHTAAGSKGFTGSLPGTWNSLFNCASYNNTTAKDTHWQDRGFVTLSADPYIDQPNDDFRPNDTAGGGALLRAAGIGVPGQTNNTDIGAVQHSDPATPTLPAAGDVDDTAAAYGYAGSLITPTLKVPPVDKVEDGYFYGAGGTEYEGTFVGGYPYGDTDPSFVLTTAAGAGTLDLSLYALLAGITWPALDAVDGGVQFGPVTGLEYEGTGVNSTTLEGILNARGITTANIALTNQPLDATETEAAAAAAIAAAGVYTGTPPTADAIGTDAASKILAEPENKLATDASGAVTPTAASKTGYSLAATGLDAIADPDDLTPATVPSTFTQKLRWLIQRFWRADKTATTIVVKTEAGATVTTQAITSSGDDQALGAPS